MHRIGEVAALTGLTVKTLRYYDDIGLLAPATVDRASGYRRYGASEVERARQIVALRQLGFSLEEVARALDAGDVRSVLEEARRRLVRSVERQQRELAGIEARLAALDAVTVRRVRPLRVVSIRDRIGAYDDADELFRELDAAVRCTGIRGTVWHRCGEHLEAEVFAETTARPAGRATASELPGVTAARTTATDDDWPEAYARLERWVPANGRRRAGPKRELIGTDPFTGACRLEILVPIEA